MARTVEVVLNSMSGKKLFEALDFSFVSVAFLGATFEDFFEAEDFLFEGFYVHFFPLAMRSCHRVSLEARCARPCQHTFVLAG